MIRNVTCKTTPVSRRTKDGTRVSAVAGAAYRAGENIKARGQGPDGSDRWFRYSNRSIVVREAFILSPEGAPDYASDRAELWNRVEEMETRKNARLGREVQLGLAYELSHDEQRALVAEFARREFVARGFVADIAIHNYGRTIPAMGASETQTGRIREFAEAGLPFVERSEAQGMADPHVLVMRDQQGQATGYKLYQPHAHIRVTPRTVENGEWVNNKQASRELNKHETAMNWRYDWAKLQNAYLKRAGVEARVRCTSDEENALPDLPRLGKRENEVTRAIEERAEQLNETQRAAHEEAKAAEERDQEFREVHNDTVRQAFEDVHSAQDDEAAADQEQGRQAAWWRNMTQRFNHWRFDFREKAAEWRDRFAQQRERLRSILGREAHEEPDDGPARTQATEDTRQEPGVTPAPRLPEPPESEPEQ